MQVLAAITRSDGRERENRGTDDAVGATRTTPNPQDTRGESRLAKVVMPLAGKGHVRATYDDFERRVATDIRSLNPQSIRTESLTSMSTTSRLMVSCASPVTR